MTLLLYRSDPYMREFDAEVTQTGDRYVVLNRTSFFPHGGGQAGDTGVIDNVRIVNTIIEDGAVIHRTEEPPLFSLGQVVHGVIDWERRYRIMRLHSASHLVYYIMQDVFGKGCKPSSSGMLDDLKDRSDYLFDGPLDRAKLVEVERKVNELIEAGVPITHVQEPGTGNRLLWKAAPYPPMECGGTHVRNTSEIGLIALKRGSKPGRGKERIELTLKG